MLELWKWPRRNPIAKDAIATNIDTPINDIPIARNIPVVNNLSVSHLIFIYYNYFKSFLLSYVWL